MISSFLAVCFIVQYPSFYDKTLSMQTRLEREFPWDIKAYAGYLIQFDKPYNIPGTIAYVFYPQPQDQTFRTSEIFFGFRRDTTDDLAYPTQGSIVLFHYELAPTFLGSGYQYTSGRLEGRRYFDLWKKEVILAARAAVGLMEPIQDTDKIPLSSILHRGLQYRQRLSLLYSGSHGYSRKSHRRSSAAAGEYGTSVSHLQRFSGVAFMDAGNVYYRISNSSQPTYTTAPVSASNIKVPWDRWESILHFL